MEDEGGRHFSINVLFDTLSSKCLFFFLPHQLKKLLLTPLNVPTGIDTHKDGVHSHRYSNRSLHPRSVRPLVKVRHPLPPLPKSLPLRGGELNQK